METKRQRHRVVCKEVLANTGDSLQVRLSSALKRYVKNGDRRQSFGSNFDPQTFRLINNVETVDNALFGVMLSYEHGTNMLVLEDDKETSSCSLMQLAAGLSEGGKRQQFVDGLLYFGVIGNTVLIIQRGVMRARNLEEHIDWLLRSKAGFPAAPAIKLSDKISTLTTEKILQKGVKWVEISSAAAQVVEGASSSITDSPGQVAHLDEHDAKGMSFGGIGLALVKSVLTADMLKQVSFLDALQQDIECTLRIRYVGRSDGHHGQRFMNNIATQLRDVEGAEATLELTNGEKVSGDQIRVSANLMFNSEDGVIEPKSAFATMLEWYKNQVGGGHMTP